MFRALLLRRPWRSLPHPPLLQLCLARVVSVCSEQVCGAARTCLTSVCSHCELGFDSSEQLRSDLQSIRKSLKLSDDAVLPAGVGLLGWILDMTEASEDPRIPAILEEKVAAVWFAFGNDLYKYIQAVRDFDAKREHKTKIFCCCNSVDEAVRAANEWKVDILVLQGALTSGTVWRIALG